jgi:hypothetical protein
MFYFAKIEKSSKAPSISPKGGRNETDRKIDLVLIEDSKFKFCLCRRVEN